MQGSSAGEGQSYEALIHLWVLRLIVQLGGHRDFLTYGYKDDEFADYLGLSPRDDSFSTKLAMMELKKLHGEAERHQEACALPTSLARNIERYRELLGWSDADKAVIAFAVLMETEPRLNFACGLIGPVTTLRLIDVLAGVLGVERGAIRNSVSPKGMLIESAFIRIDPRVADDLKSKIDFLSDETANRLRHDDGDPFELLRDVIAPAAPAALALEDFGHVQDTLDVLLPYLRRSLDNENPGVNVFVHGAPGTGKTQLTLALAKAVGCDLYEVSSQNEGGDGIGGFARLRALRAAQSMLRLRKSMVLFDEAEDVFDGSWTVNRETASAQSRKAWMNRLLENNRAPVIWLSNNVQCMDPAFLRRFDVVLEMPLPRGAQRERLVDAACDGLADARTRSRLVEARGLAPAVIERAARVVRTVKDDLPAHRTSAVLEKLIGSTLEAQGHGGLLHGEASALPDTYDPRHIAADVNLAEVADGIAAAQAGRICLYGPPGTGKTAFGRWLATRMDAPLHARRVSDIVSPYVGQTERNLARVFREASLDRAVLLLDEVDSFLQDRQLAQRTWEVTAVNEMLTQMESFDGVFIASTNLMDGLDQAALRRFDLKVRFDYLRPDQAWELFEANRQSMGLPEPGEVVRHSLARLGNLTPGDFASVRRQHHFRPLGNTDALVAALAAECKLKKSATKPVGFL